MASIMAAAAAGLTGSVTRSTSLPIQPLPAGRRRRTPCGRTSSRGWSAPPRAQQQAAAAAQPAQQHEQQQQQQQAGGQLARRLPEAHPDHRYLRRLEDRWVQGKDWGEFEIGRAKVDGLRERVKSSPMLFFGKRTDAASNAVFNALQEAAAAAGLQDQVDALWLTDLRDDDEEEKWVKALYQETRKYTVPHLFIGGRFMGSSQDIQQLKEQGTLAQMIKNSREALRS